MVFTHSTATAKKRKLDYGEIHKVLSNDKELDDIDFKQA